jgi:nitrite reductase (NADH) small subunit
MSADERNARTATGEATAFHRAASLAALRSSGSLAATVAGRAVALFAVADAVIATSGRCPHNRGPLHEGDIDGMTLTCPWHGYGFDLRTGACAEDPALVLERFEVHVEGDDVLVRL